MGYAITDVNEDGIPELVIGQTTQEGIDNMIYAVYTWKDGGFQCNAEAGIEMPSMEEPQVVAQWIDDVYLEPNGYDVFTADDGAAQRQVVFIAVSEVKDFKVLSLSFEGVDGSVLSTEF